MDLYFAGAEQGGYRDLLYANGIRHMSLSFMGLKRRVKRLDRWQLEDKFPGDVDIYLDSGAFTLNKPGSQITASEAETLEYEYRQFVEANIHRIEFASEFDANVLGHESIFEARETFWHNLPDRKWMPVWHGEYGNGNLTALSDSYGRVGVLQDDAGGDLAPILNRIAGQTRLHGISMTRMEMLREIHWDSVGSTSWLSPSKYGDTIVWTGHEMKRYPRDMKDTGRKRHRSWLSSQGFDTEKIESDDSTELLRLSIWSWQRFIEHLGVTTVPETPPDDNAERTLPPVAIPFPHDGNGEAQQPPAQTAAIERPRDRMLLPVVGFDYERVRGSDDQEHDEPRMTTPSTPLLQCNTCFMKDKCPARQQDADCAYDIPVEIRTPAQLDAAQAALIEMQTQRVLLMRMIEQREGGYLDPNLSAEITRTWKMLRDRGSTGDTVKLTLEASGQQASAGMVGRIFGEQAGRRLNELEAPVDIQTVAAEVFDAEIVDGRE